MDDRNVQTQAPRITRAESIYFYNLNQVMFMFMFFTILLDADVRSLLFTTI